MRNGWVKLHTQTLDNEFFRKDHLAWVVFTYLLLRAYDDKSQPLGKLATSRYQIAEALFSNHNAIYKAIKRLEKAKMVTTSATSKYTVFNICNWDKYQGSSNHTGNNKVTTQQQQSNSLNNNIEYRNKNISTNVLVETQRVYDLFCELFNKNPKTYKLTDKRKKQIRLRLKQNGLEQLENAIRFTAESAWHRGDNDRGWEADLDFIIRSQEQVERLGTKAQDSIKDIKEYV